MVLTNVLVSCRIDRRLIVMSSIFSLPFEVFSDRKYDARLDSDVHIK